MNLCPKSHTGFFILSVNAPSKSEGPASTGSQDDSLETGVRKSSDLHIYILPLSTSDTPPETGCPPPELVDGIRDTGAVCQIDQTRNPEEAYFGRHRARLSYVSE